MSRNLTNTFIFLCAIVGCFLSLFLTYQHSKPGLDIGCGFTKSGCSGVLKSDYSKVGPIPTALLGFGMYAGFVGLTQRRKKALRALREAEMEAARAYATSASNETAEDEHPAPAVFVPDVAALPRAAVRQLDAVIWGLALAGFLTSWFLQYIALFVVLGFCGYCFTSAILVTLIFICATWDQWIQGRTLTDEQKMLGGISAFIAVLLAFLYGPTIREQMLFIKMPPPPEGNGKATIETIAPKDLHVKGDPKATTLIVEFADYKCPSCARAVETLDKAMQAHPKMFRLGFRNFPLNLSDHKWNREAAAAAEAAGLQGKFWEMHDLIFQRQNKIKPEENFNPSDFNLWARELGLDEAKFASDRVSEAILRRIEQDSADAGAGGIKGTPTFFLIKDGKMQRVDKSEDMKNLLEDPTDPIWQPTNKGKDQTPPSAPAPPNAANTSKG